MKDNKVKFDIVNGQSFFADEAGVIHNPLKFIFDFRSITPRVDVRNQEYQTLVLNHNVVVMDPFTAKSISEILKKNIKNYEKKFGKIDKPNALKKIEKESKSAKKGKKIAPNYFG
ncbi:DUF3467 domain-containing protein [archaeon]|jgi:hypothetical protein|nr:DUF3467 domain-containing protein [archaeon]MBT4021899.1 DUF3467 domain-containing protein [archaeon]MBT4272194.1 DUF3467 domain-containing protein [archaeon]MBT4461716.1 DUF3467 domain-containing protein [archaeon]MBT4858224.1 DUF3467 domain-containing protein [archaeon]